MTVEEWFAMEEDEPGELVDGRLEEEERPDVIHEVIVCWITAALRTWLRPRRGVVGGSDAKFVVGPKRGRKPDAWAFLPGSKLPPARGPVHVPPDIVVEIVSPPPRDSRRDRVAKMDDYARALAASSGRMRRVPGCRGLALDLDELWAEVDELPQ